MKNTIEMPEQLDLLLKDAGFKMNGNDYYKSKTEKRLINYLDKNGFIQF